MSSSGSDDALGRHKLGGSHDSRTSTYPSRLPRSDQPGTSALTDEVTFEFGERCSYVKKESARRSTGVDRLCERSKFNPLAPEPLNRLDEMRKRPTETIEPPHDERVTWVEVPKCRRKLRTVGPRAGCVINEDTNASRITKQSLLRRRLLIAR